VLSITDVGHCLDALVGLGLELFKELIKLESRQVFVCLEERNHLDDLVELLDCIGCVEVHCHREREVVEDIDLLLLTVGPKIEE